MVRPYALVVEDNPINLELITLLLENEGFEVTAAHDADQALQSVLHRLPDIFILDVQLPGMSGLDLLRTLRARPDTAAICAVVVTSYAMDADRATAQAAGCDWYITKPIDTRRFGNEIREAFDRSAVGQAFSLRRANSAL